MNTVRLSPIVVIVAVFAAATTPMQSTAAEGPPSAADGALFERLDANRDGKVVSSEIAIEHQRLFARLLRQADVNNDESLSRDEFIAGLVPSRPEKPLEEKQSASNPQTDAIRWLLLSMDTSGNNAIEKSEVPERFKRPFEAMLDRIDGDKDGMINRRELYQGARQLGQIARRYVDSEEIDVSLELKKMEKKMGAAAFNRFDAPPPRFENMGDPEQAKKLFAQIDLNNNGQIVKSEIPEPLQRPLERLMRQADRDNDGQLSEEEFLAASRQMARRRGREGNRPRPSDDARPDESMPAEKMPANNQ